MTPRDTQEVTDSMPEQTIARASRYTPESSRSLLHEAALVVPSAAFELHDTTFLITSDKPYDG